MALPLKKPPVSIGDLEEEVKRRLAALLHLSEERLSADARLKDLVMDSFLLVEMAIDLQEDLGVRFSQEDLKAVETVADLVSLVERRGAERHARSGA